MNKVRDPTPEQHRAAIQNLMDERDRLRMELQKIIALDGFHDLIDAKSIAHRALTGGKGEGAA